MKTNKSTKPNGKKWTVSESDAYFVQLEKDCTRLYSKAFRHATNEDRNFLRSAVYGPPPTDRLLAINRFVRLWSQYVFANILLDHWRQGTKNGLHYYSLTVISPDHYTGDVNTMVNWPKIKRIAAEILREMQCNFIGCAEIQALLDQHFIDTEGVDHGRLLSGHTHSTFWLPKHLNCRELSNKFSKRFGETIGGAKPVLISKIGAEPKDIYHWVRYTMKSPLYQKQLQKVGSAEMIAAGKYRTKMTVSYAKKHGRLVRRLGEIHSYADMDNLLFSGGSEGKAIKNAGINAVRATLRAHGMQMDKNGEVGDLYAVAKFEQLWAREREIKSGTVYPKPFVLAT